MTAVPSLIGEPMIAMSREEVARDLVIALAVVTPPIQFGRGRRLPGQSDADRARAAELIVKYFERCGVFWFRPAREQESRCRERCRARQLEDLERRLQCRRCGARRSTRWVRSRAGSLRRTPPGRLHNR
jgi:hypothetical protein